MVLKRFAVITIVGIITLLTQQANAEALKNLTIGGAYLGLVNVFQVDGQTAAEPDHQQFDFAVNLNFDWQLGENIVGTVQIQGGTGGGSLGFAGPEGVVTDLSLTFSSSHDGLHSDVVLGSFDTPFGEETGYLTNNANAFENTLFLNDLFYSAFGGTVGTLNTLGVMGIFETKAADLTLAVTNGGDEGASNNGGDFEYVARIETSAVPGISRVGGSYMMGDDSFSADPDQADGFMADFSGWMVDGKVEPFRGTALKGYYGEVSYGDNIASTKDDVVVWMGEASYGQGPWQLAVRLSGWNPDDNDGNGGGISVAIPNPGLTNEWEEVVRVSDQKIVRLQAGGSWQLYDNLVAKLEYVRDDDDFRTGSRSTDVDGWMLLVNGSF